MAERKVENPIPWYKRHVKPSENWYRDLWIFIISAVLLWSAVSGQNTATQSKVTASQAKTLAIEIQVQRYNTIFNQCWYQNKHHDNTIGAFRKEIHYYRNHLRPGQTKADLQQAIRGNIEIINALVPRQNCTVLAGKSTKKKN